MGCTSREKSIFGADSSHPRPTLASSCAAMARPLCFYDLALEPGLAMPADSGIAFVP